MLRYGSHTVPAEDAEQRVQLALCMVSIAWRVVARQGAGSLRCGGGAVGPPLTAAAVAEAVLITPLFWSF